MTWISAIVAKILESLILKLIKWGIIKHEEASKKKESNKEAEIVFDKLSKATTKEEKIDAANKINDSFNNS